MQSNTLGGPPVDALSRTLVLLVFIDLLFIPRLLFAFGIPFSLILVAVHLVRDRLYWAGVLCLLVLATAMSASVAFGTASGSNTLPVDSVKRAVQLFTILLYAFVRIDVLTIRPALGKVLRAFFLYVFLAAFVFYIDAALYEELITTFYPEAMDELSSNILYARFPYIYSDPNSAAYLICLCLVLYFALERSRAWAMFCGVLATVAVISTQSRGAYIAMFLILGNQLLSSKTSRGFRLGTLAFLGLILCALFYWYGEDVAKAYSVFELRFDAEEDLGGGRTGKYLYFIQNFNLLPFGTGYNLQIDGIAFRPHSDLIRLDLAYGILAIPLLMFFVVPRVRSQVLLFVVFLIPFLINTVIDDYRLLPFYLLSLQLLGQRRSPTFRVATRHGAEKPHRVQA